MLILPTNKSAIAIRALLYASLMLFLFYFRFGTGFNLSDMDYNSFYSAGQAMELELNPYFASSLNSEEVSELVGDVEAEGLLVDYVAVDFDYTYPYVYPPTLGLLFSGVDYHTGRFLLACISFVLLLISFLLLERILARELSPLWSAVIVASLLVFSPFLYIIYIGQIDIVLFFAFMLFAYMYCKGKSKELNNGKAGLAWPIAALLLGFVALLKPHGIFLFFLAPLLPRGARKYMTIGILLSLLYPIIVGQGDTLIQFSVMLIKGPDTTGLPALLSDWNHSLTAFIGKSIAPESHRLITISALTALGLLSAFVLWKKADRNSSPLLLFPIMMTLFLLFTPYLWFQHGSYLIMALLAAYFYFSAQGQRSQELALLLILPVAYWSIAEFLFNQGVKGPILILPLLLISTILYYLYLLYRSNINRKEKS